MALLRVCPECKTHKLPRIMGWSDMDDPNFRGISHGICDKPGPDYQDDGCLEVLLEEVRALRRAREWQVRKDAGAPPPRA